MKPQKSENVVLQGRVNSYCVQGKEGKHAFNMSAKILSGQQTGNNKNSDYFVRTLMNIAQRSCYIGVYFKRNVSLSFPKQISSNKCDSESIRQNVILIPKNKRKK